MSALRYAGRQADVGPAAWSTAPATLALLVVDVVAAAAMGRLFRGSGWVVPVLGSAVASHVVAWGARRSRWGLVPAVVGAVMAVGLVLIWSVLGSSTFYGFPTAHTFGLLGQDVAGARSAFANLVAPVPTLPGFVLVAGAGAGLAATLADWAGFRLRTLLESVVPALAVIVFVSVLAPSPPGAVVTGLLVATIGAYVAVYQSVRRTESAARFTGGSDRRRLLGPAGLGMVAVVAVSGAVIGPRLPGARSDGLVALHHRGPDQSSERTTISPLVDIRSRLINQADTELFTVTAPTAAYWRLTSLDTFDGNIWSSNESYSPAAGPLPGQIPSVGRTTLRQSFQIETLGSIWLPAAYIPTSLSFGTGISWDPISDSLISRSLTSDGESYRVTSAVPQLDTALLRTARTSSLPSADVAHYTALPPAVPADVVALARRITAGMTTPFDKALALQNYLRDNYRYSLAVQPGHSDSAIENFLFRSKTGYCEQFAGSYAVMARAVGLPTRVAVGFTPGEADSGGDRHVFGSDAHAWPEVLLGRFGWVAFEPTPGRGNPQSTSYSGVAPSQAAGPGQPSTSVTQAQPPAPSVPPPTTPHISVKETAPKAAPHHAIPAGVVAGLVVLGLVLAWVLALPALRRARRQRRRQLAAGEADLVLAAWQDANGWLDLVDRRRQDEETLMEHARRVVDGIVLGPDSAAALRTLAERASAASYSEAVPAGFGAAAAAEAGEVERAVISATKWWRRLARELDPRRLSRV